MHWPRPHHAHSLPPARSGPGIKAGELVATPTAHEDILPTILALAGAPLPDDLDGQPLPLPLEEKHEVSASYSGPVVPFEQ